MTKRILGYTSELSVEPGGSVDVMVSCYGGIAEYTHELVRLIHGDLNPAGPGFKSEAVPEAGSGRHQGREQETRAGSYGVVPSPRALNLEEGFSVQAYVWPTTPNKGRQVLVSRVSNDGSGGFAFGIDDEGCPFLELRGRGGRSSVSTGTPLLSRHWYLVSATYAAHNSRVSVTQTPLLNMAGQDEASVSDTVSLDYVDAGVGSSILFAAEYEGESNGSPIAKSHFNGKIERPRLASVPLSASEITRLSDVAPDLLDNRIVGAWDFSREMSGLTVVDLSPNELHGRLVNLPVRAMKGANWSGDCLRWTDRPEQYGAIHFHDDDLYDAGWDADFTLHVPEDVRSGIYAVHLAAEDAEDYVPLVVRPSAEMATAEVLLVLPTTSYLAYANEHMPTDAPLAQLLTDQVLPLQEEDIFLAEHREFGGSTYDTHSDGSGICYSSRLRPILNMRPKYANWLGGSGSALWQFNADLHITDWLEAKGFAYDVISDEDLHREGVAVLSRYSAVLTGTHPEYTSTRMRDAYEAYLSRGGRLMYMGGNGFYWRTSYSSDLPGVIEVRKGEGGIRAWAAEPGEYYNAFTGEYSGLWRRSGRPPQQLVGVGFISQGFDVSSYYVRKDGGRDPRAAFIFEGIADNEKIGDFGLVGGGAAGLELDHADPLLGTPPHALVLASSEGHTDVYMVVLEEILINAPGLTGSQSPLVTSDLVFFETPSGGAVFSTGSIAFSGSLSHNRYDNNISRLTENVLRRFIDPKPFAFPEMSSWPVS